MTPERFRQIEELYHAAREATADERAALLAQTDPELRRELESLFAQRTGDEYRHTIDRHNRGRQGARDVVKSILRQFSLSCADHS
jgi:hypothetical protein